MATTCTCPTLAECARAGCPHCRQEIAAGRPTTDKACSVAGSPPCPSEPYCGEGDCDNEDGTPGGPNA